MKGIKYTAASAAAVLLSAALLTSHASADTVEDVYAAMEKVGCTDSMIADARSQYASSLHDENGMTMGTEYHTYEEWVSLIYENGALYVCKVIAEEFCVDPQDILDYYTMTTTAETTRAADDTDNTAAAQTTHTTTVSTPEKAFADMTLEEKKAYIASLPYDERVAFLATLSVKDRKSIFSQLDSDKKADIAAGLVDFGGQIGLNVSVDGMDGDNIRVSVRDESGKLIDSTAIGWSIDPTGWDTTLPVLGSAAAISGSLSGIFLLSMRKNRKEQSENG